ncbi:MAG: Bacterial dynamin-like protein [Candidatus Hydrogenedentes bacterium ADurb.Bin179]|nr:MAG: Bacterial dynamin-like protein [Candidatus Hydrogenedentes bacterium ADurb.Bin179]
MLINPHQENREWLLTALDYLETFAGHDVDYFGDRNYESKAIAYQRSVVNDGKYRVVFLGAFNVGKSTAINAFLGGTYLPMDIEECTSRLTFIQKGDDLRLVLKLESGASHNEIDALRRALSDIEADIEISQDNRTLTVMCPGKTPAQMRRALEPLITVSADEDYPHLAPLRDKTESLTLYLPTDALDDDIIFIDTPGVHSISDTRQKITYDIIEHCHLVVVFVDSAFVGNVHDLNFIKRIITCRGRRVFFVLNKADKLENDEIDPRAVHGPAAQLVDTFRRHEIPDSADTFFLSGYRAMAAIGLDQGQITLEEVLADNKLMIPTAVAERIAESAAPARDLSAFLMGQSRFSHLMERLRDYLINENKSNAVLSLADRFVFERASDYLISIRNMLKLARDPSKFEELRANREALLERIETIRETITAALQRYDARFRGGEVNGVTMPGYVEQMRSLLTETAIEAQVVQPTLAWLRQDNHLKQACRAKFKPLTAQLEHQVDTFVSAILGTLNETIEASEKETAAIVAEQVGVARELRANLVEPQKVLPAHVESSVSGEYVAFGTGGAVVGAMSGAMVGSVVPVVGTAIGAGVGGLLGAVVGFLARLAWSEERWIKKLTPLVRQNAMEMLLKGKEGGGKPISAMFTEYLENRGQAFSKAVGDEMSNALEAVKKECYALLAREEEIRKEREAVIARLEPKEVKLEGIRTRAETILEEDDLP